MKSQSDYSIPFTSGWHSLETGVTNPHLITSNNSDAYELGRFVRTLGFPVAMAGEAHKSTGYKWKLGASVFEVHGRSVRLVSSVPLHA